MSYPVVGRAGNLRMTPGRIAALAVGVPVVLSMIVFTGLSLVADLGQASFPVNYSFPVRGGQVTARVDGNITLRQGAVSTARLTGTAHYSLFRPTVTESGSTVSMNCRFPLGNCSLNGTLEVPQRSAVSVSTAGGDLSVGNYAGDVTLHTDGGNVNVGSITGSLQVSTAGGDVNVGTVNGTGLLRLTTDGGNITGQSIVAPNATVQTAGGDVSLTFTHPPADLRVTADGGNITLVLPHGPATYAVDATSDGGNVNVDKSVPRGPSASHAIYVHTAGGDINISEAS